MCDGKLRSGKEHFSINCVKRRATEKAFITALRAPQTTANTLNIYKPSQHTMTIQTIYTDLSGNPCDITGGFDECKQSDSDALLKRLGAKLRDDRRNEKRRKPNPAVKAKKLELF